MVECDDDDMQKKAQAELLSGVRGDVQPIKSSDEDVLYIARGLCFDYLAGAMRRHDRVNCERQCGAARKRIRLATR